MSGVQTLNGVRIMDFGSDYGVEGHDLETHIPLPNGFYMPFTPNCTLFRVCMYVMNPHTVTFPNRRSQFTDERCLTIHQEQIWLDQSCTKILDMQEIKKLTKLYQTYCEYRTERSDILEITISTATAPNRKFKVNLIVTIGFNQVDPKSQDEDEEDKDDESQDEDEEDKDDESDVDEPH